MDDAARGGVRPDAIKIVPEVVDVDKVYGLVSETAFQMTDDTTVYLSIFKWKERKAWKVLLTAYFQAFSAQDDVALVLFTNGYYSTLSSAEDFMNISEKFALEATNKPLKELSHGHVLPPRIDAIVVQGCEHVCSAIAW